MGAILTVAVLGGALLALGGRRRPTVWPGPMLRAVMVAIALALAGFNRFGMVGALLAGIAIGVAVLSVCRNRDSVVLFARSGAVDDIAGIIERIGIPAERTGNSFTLARPAATISARRVLPRVVWVSISAREATRKLKLLEDVLHKQLSN